MPVHPQVQTLQPAAEPVGGLLAPVMGQAHGAHIELAGPEGVDQAQGLHVVGDAQVAPALVALNVVGGDDHHHLGLLLHLHEHPDLAVGPEAGENPGGVEVVKEFAAEFQIQLAAEFPDPLADPFRLELYVFIVVKTDAIHILILSCQTP